MAKKWWLAACAFALIYLALAIGPLVYRAWNPIPERVHYLVSPTPYLSILGEDSRGNLAIVEDDGVIQILDPSKKQVASISPPGDPWFAEFDEEDMGFVATNDLILLRFDPATGKKLWQTDLLHRSASPASAPLLNTFGLCETTGEAWVFVDQTVEAWATKPLAKQGGVMLKTPALSAFAASRRGNFFCYAELGTGKITRQKFSTTLARATPLDTFDVGEGVVALAMDEDSDRFYALTARGKLYFVDKAPVEIGQIDPVEAYEKPIFTLRSGILLCGHRSRLLTSALADPRKISIEKYPFIASAIVQGNRRYVGYQWKGHRVIDLTLLPKP